MSPTARWQDAVWGALGERLQFVVTGAYEMRRDLDHLALALEDAARMFHDEVVRVRAIASQI